MANKRHIWVIEYYSFVTKEWHPLQVANTRKDARGIQKRDCILYKTRIAKYTPEKKEVSTWQTILDSDY